MSKMTSNKPYFIRGLYEWIVDNDLTPNILVDAMHPDVEVPQHSVKGGRIILNIAPKACQGLHIDNDKIVFTARFSGQATQIFLPPTAVLAIYAKENGRGMEFEHEYDVLPPKESKPSRPKANLKPFLKLVTGQPPHEDE